MQTLCLRADLTKRSNWKAFMNNRYACYLTGPWGFSDAGNKWGYYVYYKSTYGRNSIHNQINTITSSGGYKQWKQMGPYHFSLPPCYNYGMDNNGHKKQRWGVSNVTSSSGIMDIWSEEVSKGIDRDWWYDKI